jgi:IS1 family transposase
VANVLSAERRLEVLAALVNGTSIRAASRMTGVHQDTIGRFALAMGEGCARLHDRIVRDLSCALVDLDEQHSWCSKRQVRVDPAKDDESIVGEQWTWAAICRTSKLVIAWHVGKRDATSADVVVAETRARLVVMPQITTDGLDLYEAPILLYFGYAVPYVQTIKRYANAGGEVDTRAEGYSHQKGVNFIEKRVIYGAPDLGKATTYAIERSNLTNRQWNARLHRRTLAFSKDVARHAAAISLGYVYRNLCHIQRNMRVTPAMAAGVTDRVWSLPELMEAALTEPAGEERREFKPLVIPEPPPEVTARALPNGRGFLRALPGGNAPAPAPAPAPPPAVPAVAAVPAAPPAEEPTGQLDLLAWRPKVREVPPKGAQLTLFDEPTN